MQSTIHQKVCSKMVLQFIFPLKSYRVSQETLYRESRIFFETDANVIYNIVCIQNLHTLSFLRILNYENVTFMTEVIAYFVQLVKFRRF